MAQVEQINGKAYVALLLALFALPTTALISVGCMYLVVPPDQVNLMGFGRAFSQDSTLNLLMGLLAVGLNVYAIYLASKQPKYVKFVLEILAVVSIAATIILLAWSMLGLIATVIY